ncbi:MAG TPA: hypothetical protein VEY51_19630 [Chondromyces sp.]|nr:hypothetical protein [Chondromyces sp.]
MGMMTFIVVGFSVLLLAIGGVFVYYLRSALDTEDSIRVDKQKEPPV